MSKEYSKKRNNNSEKGRGKEGREEKCVIFVRGRGALGDENCTFLFNLSSKYWIQCAARGKLANQVSNALTKQGLSMHNLC